jgi:hypothetical protein
LHLSSQFKARHRIVLRGAAFARSLAAVASIALKPWRGTFGPSQPHFKWRGASRHVESNYRNSGYELRGPITRPYIKSIVASTSHSQQPPTFAGGDMSNTGGEIGKRRMGEKITGGGCVITLSPAKESKLKSIERLIPERLSFLVKQLPSEIPPLGLK